MTSGGPLLLDALRMAVGDAGLLLRPDALGGYEIGARHGLGRAAAVVRPRSATEASAVVRACRRHGARVVTQGANTGLVDASTPDAGGEQVVLSTDRLQALPAIDVANRTVRVSAGTRLSTLNAALDPHGLFLPIDLGADPTIGGMVSTNTGGARFIRYGDMRRQILGLEVVLLDDEGRIVQLRGGLRKDNSGLDLRQLVVGAGGALGIVTEVELEVQLRPRQSATALVLLADPASAQDLLEHFEREAGELLGAFEGMSRAALDRTLAHARGLRDPIGTSTCAYVVLVELATVRIARDDEAGIDAVLQDCLASWLARPKGVTLDVLLGRPEELWALRHAIPEALRAAGEVVGFDLAFRRGDTAAFRARLLPILSNEFPEFTLCDFGHIGDGGVHFNLVRKRSAPLPTDRLASLRARVYDVAVREFGGSFSGEHGLGRANLGFYVEYTDPGVRSLAGAVQSAFTDEPWGAVDYGKLADAPVVSPTRSGTCG